MSKQSGRSFRVGYALAPKKEQTFATDSLINHLKKHGVEFIRIELNKSLFEQGHFDCIVHKVYSHDWSNQLAEFSAKHPHVVIVDPPHLIEKLHNRVSMLEVVSQLNLPQKDVSFGVPKQAVIEETEALRSGHAVEEPGLEFPLIAKPFLVDGSHTSHQLCLVFDKDGLKALVAPIVLQQFVNHGGVVFKIYVAGEQVICVKRTSLPDISNEMLKTLSGAISFSQISNLAIEENGHDKRMQDIETAEMPSTSIVNDVAKALREAMGLQLFNVDVIRDANDRNRYLVIDINYFPGYEKVPEYELFMTDFFLKILHKENWQAISPEDPH